MAKHENQIVGQPTTTEAQVHLNEKEFAEKYPDIYETIRKNLLNIDLCAGWSNWNIFEALDFAYQKGRDCGCEESELYEKEVGELKMKIEDLKAENKQLKEDNDTLRKNQTVWVDNSGKAIDGLLGQATDTHLATLFAKRGYHGEISRSGRLYDSSTQTNWGEKIETIKI